MNYSVLALDQAMLSTGWAHFRKGDAQPTWGLKTMESWAGREGQCAWAWFEWLGKKCTELAVTHLFIEDVRFAHKHLLEANPSGGHEEGMSELLASMGQILLADIVAYVMTRRGEPLECRYVSPLDWRRVFMGVMKKPDGMAKPLWRKELKDAAIRQCHARGWIVENNDPADALGIMVYGLCVIDPTYQSRNVGLFKRAEAQHETFLRENR